MGNWIGATVCTRRLSEVATTVVKSAYDSVAAQPAFVLGSCPGFRLEYAGLESYPWGGVGSLCIHPPRREPKSGWSVGGIPRFPFGA